MDKWLIRNGVLLTVLSVIVAAMSCLKEMVFANLFGVSNIADAYTVAMTLPEVLFAVVWTAMNTILIPMYQNKIQNEDSKDANRFISVFFTTIILFCIGFVVFSELITDFWIYLFAPGFDNETHNLAVTIARWIFPMLIFEGVERVCIGVLQTHKRFILTKMLSLIRNISIVIFLILFASNFGVFAAVIGIISGVFLEALISFVGSRSVEKLQFIIDFRDSSLRKAGKLAIPIIIGTGVGELNVLIDKVVASYLETGSMIALSYAARMEGIVTTIVLLNIVSLAFPLFSEYVARGEIEELRHIYEKTLKMLLLLAVPIVIGGFILGKEIISIAFMRGAFDYQAVLLVAPLFSIYLSAALFNTIRTMSVNLFASFGETKLIMFNTILAVILNAIFNIIFSRFFGAVGLACASLLSAVFASSRLIYLINRDKFKIDYSKLGVMTAKVICSGSIMGIVIYIFKSVSGKILVIDTTIIRIVETFGLVGIGIGVYLCLLKIMKVSEINIIFTFIKKK